MDAKHKEILRSRRPDLVREMEMDGLLTELLASKVISDLMVKRIKSKQTPAEQHEELLDKLPTRGAKAFDLFCEALIKTEQEHLVTEYLKPEGNCSAESQKVDTSAATSTRDVVMSAEHTSKIRKHYDDIVCSMVPERLSNSLLAAKVLTMVEKDDIDSKTTSNQKNELILKCILRKPDSAYYEFIKALEKCEQPHVAGFLKI